MRRCSFLQAATSKAVKYTNSGFPASITSCVNDAIEKSVEIQSEGIMVLVPRPTFQSEFGGGAAEHERGGAKM